MREIQEPTVVHEDGPVGAPPTPTLQIAEQKSLDKPAELD
jgi:hypothetical protein